MEPEGSLYHSQQPDTFPSPEPDQSTPCPTVPLPEELLSYYPPIVAWVFQV